MCRYKISSGLNKRLFIMLNLFIYTSVLLISNAQNDSPENQQGFFSEKVYLRTDRDLYVSGEQVQVKIYCLEGQTGSPSSLSKVAYLELLDKNNFPLTQAKVKISGSSGITAIDLPVNLQSGNYILRAYSAWMKNFSPDLFCYRTISVINPFGGMDKFDVSSLKNGDPAVKKDFPAQFAIASRQNKSLNVSSDQNVSSGLLKFNVLTDNNIYSTRQKVKISVNVTDEKGKPVKADYTISVARTVTVNSSDSRPFRSVLIDSSANTKARTGNFLAELEGLLVSGILRTRTSNEPLKHIPLSLSLVGKNALCQFGSTDNNGEFNFLLKENGPVDIVIQPLSQDLTDFYIELYQPFSNSFSQIKPTPLGIDSTYIDEINKMIIAAQVNSAYIKEHQDAKPAEQKFYKNFYGKPENSVKMADYIELTSLKEVIKEIIPNVSTSKQNGKYEFKLINKYRGQPFENKPLVLVDGVPVYDIDKILGISSKDIETIDIINTRYFISENIFDGIVSLTSRKGNLTVLDFNNSIFRQIYEGYHEQGLNFLPDYSSESRRNSKLPDFRNTLYWSSVNQSLMPDPPETMFFTSDEKGSFTITVEGIGPNGEKGLATAVFTVK
jgi:hypothetical protein